MKYAIRIPANDILQRDIEELLKRPVGRPTKKPLVEYKGFLYQAAGWKTARRVVAKVEHHSGLKSAHLRNLWIPEHEEVAGMAFRLFARKSVDQLLEEVADEEHGLRQALGPLNLVALGVGAIIGGGIFVLTGVPASQYAGPAIVLSFVLAGLWCGSGSGGLERLRDQFPAC